MPAAAFADETARARAAQAGWAAVPLRKRLAVVAAVRRRLVAQADTLCAAVEADVGRPADEVTATDLLPVAAACKAVRRFAPRVLATRRATGTPLWLFGTKDRVERRPRGVVGLIGTWNYPIFLTAVPLLHAIVAGNAVLWKPSEQTPRTAEVLGDLLAAAGVPEGLIIRLPATREAGPMLAEADVDFVHFTGSAAVGRKLAARLGERLIPSAMELSGCDAMIVLAGADPVAAARAAWYGATLNAGQTCLAIRRAIVAKELLPQFTGALRGILDQAPRRRLVTAGQQAEAERLVADARAAGAEVLQAAGDGFPPTVLLNVPASAAVHEAVSFAPLLAVTGFDFPAQAVEIHERTPYRLTAAVFGPREQAELIAGLIDAGAVAVNDVVVSAAHPDTPFGGRGQSGWGVTQGPEGLLEMTVPRVTSVRRTAFRPHVEAGLTADPAMADIGRGMLRAAHAGGVGDRLAGLWQLFRGLRRSGKVSRHPAEPAGEAGRESS